MPDFTLEVQKNNCVIEGFTFNSDAGNCITVLNKKNVIIRNNRFDRALLSCIDVRNCDNVWILDNDFNDMGCGVVAVNSSNVKIGFNKFKNTTRRVTGTNGQFVQLSECLDGNEIYDNFGINIEGQSAPEDLISIYKNKATQAGKTIIRDNFFIGGGASLSGGGIMTGDRGGTWIEVLRNKLVNPGQYGIAVAGGSDILIDSNRVYAIQKTWNNVGMYAWAQGGTPNPNGTGFIAERVTISNNKVHYINKNSIRNDYWFHANVIGLVQTNNTSPNLSPDFAQMWV